MLLCNHNGKIDDGYNSKYVNYLKQENVTKVYLFMI